MTQTQKRINVVGTSKSARKVIEFRMGGRNLLMANQDIQKE